MQQQSPYWSDAAIRDTVETIVRQAAYQQTIGESLWSRAAEWMSRVVRRLFEIFAGSDSGRVIVTVLFVVLVAVVVARIVIGIRHDRGVKRQSRRAAVRSGGLHSMAEAEQLAARGEYLAAAHALCAALLQACAARGDVRLHPSKTTGDYARELRRREAPAASGFQLFRARYDRLVYDDVAIDESDFRWLHNAATAVLDVQRAA